MRAMVLATSDFPQPGMPVSSTARGGSSPKSLAFGSNPLLLTSSHDFRLRMPPTVSSPPASVGTSSSTPSVSRSSALALRTAATSLSSSRPSARAPRRMSLCASGSERPRTASTSSCTPASSSVTWNPRPPRSDNVALTERSTSSRSGGSSVQGSAIPSRSRGTAAICPVRTIVCPGRFACAISFRRRTTTRSSRCGSRSFITNTPGSGSCEMNIRACFGSAVPICGPDPSRPSPRVTVQVQSG